MKMEHTECFETSTYKIQMPGNYPQQNTQHPYNVTVRRRTGHEDPEGELRYSCTLSLTSALDVVGGQRHVPAALPPRKIPYPFYRRLGGPQGRSGRAQKTMPPTGIRFPDRPVCSESLYRLSYPGPFCKMLIKPI
jgi:hypothetical protein